MSKLVIETTMEVTQIGNIAIRYNKHPTEQPNDHSL